MIGLEQIPDESLVLGKMYRFFYENDHGKTFCNAGKFAGITIELGVLWTWMETKAGKVPWDYGVCRFYEATE